MLGRSITQPRHCNAYALRRRGAVQLLALDLALLAVERVIWAASTLQGRLPAAGGLSRAARTAFQPHHFGPVFRQRRDLRAQLAVLRRDLD